MSLHGALVSIFGAQPDQIHVSDVDHLCATLTPAHVEHLLVAVGGPWAEILERIALRRAAASLAKDPGVDVRNLSDKERAALQKARVA